MTEHNESVPRHEMEALMAGFGAKLDGMRRQLTIGIMLFVAIFGAVINLHRVAAEKVGREVFDAWVIRSENGLNTKANLTMVQNHQESINELKVAIGEVRKMMESMQKTLDRLEKQQIVFEVEVRKGFVDLQKQMVKQEK